MSEDIGRSWRGAGSPGRAFSGYLPVFAGSALLIAAGLLVAWRGWTPAPELSIGLGFFLFFVAPGLSLSLLLFPHKKFMLLERLPLSVALSSGVWAFPGLLAFRMEWSLKSAIFIELIIVLALFAAALVRHLFSITRFDPDPCEVSSPGNGLAIAAVTIGLCILAFWTGAFRGEVLDWDYFNYISAVRKLVAWDAASNAHFAYGNAPPDPIHSYNIWALQWAAVARLYHLDPITLYARSAFLTVPAAALSFYALARRLFSANVARTAFFIFAGYQVFYGGLLFLGRTTFYPADSQWLIVFPACLVLFLRMFEDRWDGLVIGLSLSVLGMSIVHVFWGLCFYLVCGIYLLIFFFQRQGTAKAFTAAFPGGRAFQAAAVIAWSSVPALLMFINVISMAAGDRRDGFSPLLGGGADLSPWFYLLAFVAVPVLYLAWLIAPFKPRRGKDLDRESNFLIAHTAYIIIVCLVIAVPYIYLRYRAIGVTDWEQFGRNPYRAFITSSTFFLNPFQRSLGNPNMSFFPIYLAGYLCLPALFIAAGKHHAPRLALGALLAVPLICFHPCLATLFAEHFSLGYLRRLLRLAALFSFFPLALVVHRVINAVFDQDRRPVLHISLALLVAALIGVACIPASASPPYYNRMLERAIAVSRTYPGDSLVHDDEPFLAIKEKGWFHANDVIFSDIWTSYRLTAYLPVFVCAQAKPGVGVSDQDRRRMLEAEFFDAATPVERMREILEGFGAAGVIANRSPGYRLYNIPCGHPEAIGKMKADPEHFELLYDKGDWVIFRFQ
jgi:hypothetical protein